jgi:concanavalin A-like lectin/glucanase superfamily protein
MAEFKFFCPQCGRHIQCDTSYSGTQIDCPVCKQSIVVPQPPRTAPAVEPPLRVKSRAFQNVLVIATAALVLAGLVIGGWYGYSKMKISKLPPGLVSLWSGDGNGNDSAGRNNATVPKGVTYEPAKVGLGFKLNSLNQRNETPRIIVPDAPELNFDTNQDFSIDTWIKMPPGAGSGNTFGVMSIVDKRIASGGSDSPNGYEFSLQNGQIDCRFGSVSFVSPGPDLRDGKFHHVALTVSRNSATGGKLYADGVVVMTFDPTFYNGSLVNAQPLRIGNHAALDLNCFFNGVIDEVGIYNRALSASEIQAIYTEQK